MPGDQQQLEIGGQLGLRQVIAIVVYPDQRGDQGVVRHLPFHRDQLVEIGVDLTHGFGYFRRRVCGIRDQLARPVPDLRPIIDRDTKELANHHDRQWLGELCDEIRRPGLGGQLVQQAVYEVADPGFESFDRAPAERLGHEAADPGVLWRIHAGQELGIGGRRIAQRTAGASGRLTAEPRVEHDLTNHIISQRKPRLVTVHHGPHNWPFLFQQANALGFGVRAGGRVEWVGDVHERDLPGDDQYKNFYNSLPGRILGNNQGPARALGLPGSGRRVVTGSVRIVTGPRSWPRIFVAASQRYQVYQTIAGDRWSNGFTE